MSASKAKQAETATRRAQLIDLRLVNVSFDDPRILALGYKSPNAARKDMCRTLDRAVKRESLNVDQYRKLQEQRLLSLVAAVWPKATEGDLPAVEQTRKLIADLTKLFGLEAPIKTELSGPGGGPLQLAPTDIHELHRLIGMAGEPDPDSDDDSEYADEAYEGEPDPDDSDDADDGS